MKNNIETICKIILTIVTLIIDVIFIYVYFNFPLSLYDKIYIISILVIHSLFYLFLWWYNSTIIFILHVLLFICLLLAVFLTNKVLLGTVLFLLLFIIIAWIIFNKCILNEDGQTFGFDTELEICTIILTGVIIYKLFKNYDNVGN